MVAAPSPGPAGASPGASGRGGPATPVQFGQYPPARRTILHLSDTHLLAGNVPLGGHYDTAANLRRTLAAVESLGIRPDAIVFTGDLTDLGEPDAYRRAARDDRARRRAARGTRDLGRGQS